MHASVTDLSLPLAPGQRFRVNSFDLGFINIEPVDMIVELKTVCYDTNELELSPLPLPGIPVEDGFDKVNRWFQEGYPQRTSDNCLLRNVQAFEQLVALQIAVAERRLTLSSLSPVTLRTA